MPATGFLRVRRHEAPQDPDMVRAQRGSAAVRLCAPRATTGAEDAPFEGNHELFGFLTTKAIAILAPIHPKAMPMILTTTEEFDLWLEGETVEALKLQQPLPDGGVKTCPSPKQRARSSRSPR
jgi:putative SOS response-associated peptidase YedK